MPRKNEKTWNAERTLSMARSQEILKYQWRTILLAGRTKQYPQSLKRTQPVNDVA